MRVTAVAWVLAALVACRITVDDTGGFIDADGDGVAADVDCDDADDTVGGPTTWYTDTDEDGFGDATAAVDACQPPPNHVSDDTDCDDTDGDAYPGAPEVWYDGEDQACDGGSDYDQDGDGADSDAHGGTDCDDTDAQLQALAQWWVDCDGDSAYDGSPPAGQLSTDPGSYDCDDDDDTVTAVDDWFVDCDGDGAFADTAVSSCAAPEGVCPGNTDPSDAAVVDPGSYDCDDDSQSATSVPWWVDCDGDNAFDVFSVASCGAPAGVCAAGQRRLRRQRQRLPGVRHRVDVLVLPHRGQRAVRGRPDREPRAHHQRLGLTGQFVLPGAFYLVVASGGGAAVGWEYAEIRVS